MSQLADFAKRVKATAWRYGLPRPFNSLGCCDRCGKLITDTKDIMWIQVSGPFGAKAVQRVHGVCAWPESLPLPIDDTFQASTSPTPPNGINK